MTERQELFCHNCQMYVQFNVDLELNGNHVCKCPNCGHEHCRVVNDGRITGDRWDSRNDSYRVTSVTYSISSTWNTYTTTTSSTCSAFMYQAWSNAQSKS